MKHLFTLAIVFSLLLSSGTSPLRAQSPTAVYPLPAANALLIYDRTTVALINIGSTPLSLSGVGFMRAGGAVKLAIATLGISSLAPNHCAQVWTTEVHQIIGKPDECAERDRYQKLNSNNTYFWVADDADEPFHPQLNNSTLTLCPASKSTAQRCTFYIPQGDDAQKPWVVLDPATGIPMPAGIQVAYDANAMWIANVTPHTVLPTSALRVFYPLNGKTNEWTPAASTWDFGAWDGRPIAAGQCLVLYQDASKIVPLLPCDPIGKAVVADQPWHTQFEVMGPREDRHSVCGEDQSAAGPVLCVISG